MVLDSILGIKLTFILGITNIIGISLVFLSCRCLMGKNLSKFLFKYDWYKKFYGYHCYYWWFFIISVLLHSLIALTTYGIPSLIAT